MSDLLNQASLVMVPSGYKEDTVYSVVPSDGSGDLSFTRASNGTRVNSAGLVEVVAWNLLQQSETFDNAYWSKAQVTVSANATTAPNGTTTADKIISSAVNDEHVIYYFESNILSQVVTMSAYVKKADYRYAVLRSFTNGGYQISVFDLDNGIVSSQVLGASTIENVGNGWYRISTTFTAPAGTYGVQYGFSATPTYSYLGNGTSGNFLWGAQLNIGSTAKPYFPTTDRLNVPRLTYQNGGGGCPSLLLEKQSTNLVTYSEQFDNADWLKYVATISVNTTTSPDGTQNADSLVSDSGQYGVLYKSSQFTAGQNITLSIFAKANTSSTIKLGTTDAGIDYGGVFNLSNGTITSSTGVTASIQSMGNGWYRCIVNRTMTGSANIFVVEQEGGKSVYIWGAQGEASSYSTSYIQTTSSSATRVADACSKTGISSLIGQTEGVIFFDGYFGNETDEMYAFIQNSLGNSTTSSMYLIKSSSGIKFQSYDSSTTLQWEIQGGSYTIGQRIKIAGAYKANDIVLYVNGVQIGTDTSATIPTCTALQIGVYPASPTANFQYNGKVNQAILFPTRLTNAELASLTTI